MAIKGREYFALLQFDISAARSLTVEKAALRFYRNSSPAPLHTVGLSSISGSGPWEEGTQNGGTAQSGAANCWFARRPAVLGLCRVRSRRCGARPRRPRDAGDGWFEADLPAELGAASAATSPTRPCA